MLPKTVALTMTMPALTFSKAGTFTVKLNLETGGSKFVSVKVKK